MRTLLLALLLASMAFSAPAPACKPRQITPGEYTLMLGETPYAMILSPDGNYEAQAFGTSRWWGSWAWCPKFRVLAIHETTGGVHWSHFVVQMDGMSLTGKSGTTEVEVRRKTP